MAAAARSVLRSASIRGGAARVAAEAVAASRPQLRCLPKLRPAAASRFLRSPVEASFCVESLMPMHSATATALLTSMLNVSRRGYGWLSEGLIFQHGELLNRGHAAPLPLPVSSIISIMNKENYRNFSNLCCLVIGGWSSCTGRL